MAGAVSVTKNPVFVESGRRGSLKRWGPPKTVHLGDLSPDQRRLIGALVDAARSALDKSDAAARQASPSAGQE